MQHDTGIWFGLKMECLNWHSKCVAAPPAGVCWAVKVLAMPPLLLHQLVEK